MCGLDLPVFGLRSVAILWKRCRASGSRESGFVVPDRLQASEGELCCMALLFIVHVVCHLTSEAFFREGLFLAKSQE